MNKSLALVVGVLVLIACGLWFFSENSTLPSENDMASTSLATTTTPAPVAAKTSPSNSVTKGVPNSNSYKSLLTQTGSYECDYSSVASTGQTSNVIYIYGGRMRGEFRTMVAGNAATNLFVYDGHYMYQWKEGSSVGSRTVLTSLSQLPLIIPKDLTSGSIIGSSYTSVGWQCHAWLTNKALLTPPSYVTFS